jgi:hypothetical protein
MVARGGDTGDHKGPPFLSQPPLARTDLSASSLSSSLRLMPFGHPLALYSLDAQSHQHCCFQRTLSC